MKLIATSHFSTLSPGDEISDPAEIKAILESENAFKVVKVPIPQASPDPQKAKRIK